MKITNKNYDDYCDWFEKRLFETDLPYIIISKNYDSPSNSQYDYFIDLSYESDCSDCIRVGWIDLDNKIVKFFDNDECLYRLEKPSGFLFLITKILHPDEWGEEAEDDVRRVNLCLNEIMETNNITKVAWELDEEKSVKNSTSDYKVLKRVRPKNKIKCEKRKFDNELFRTEYKHIIICKDDKEVWYNVFLTNSLNGRNCNKVARIIRKNVRIDSFFNEGYTCRLEGPLKDIIDTNLHSDRTNNHMVRLMNESFVNDCLDRIIEVNEIDKKWVLNSERSDDICIVLDCISNSNCAININDYEVKEIKEENKNIKGDVNMNTMNNMFGEFNFGAVKGDKFKVTVSGDIAFKNRNKYVTFDKEKHELKDMTMLSFDSNGMVISIPTPIDKVDEGDIIMYDDKPYFVLSSNGSEFEVIDPSNNTKLTILPVKNMFGFNFVSKITNLLNCSAMGMNPMMLMMMSGENTGDMNPMMLMMMSSMMGGNNNDGSNNDLMKMMMLSNMMGGSNNINPMMLMMMSGMFNK